MESGVKLLPMRKEPKSKNILQIIRIDWERFCNTPVVIPPAVSSIWMNLSDDQEAKVLQILGRASQVFQQIRT